MFDYNQFKHADKKKLQVLACAMQIDHSPFKSNEDFIKAFEDYDKHKHRPKHDWIGKLFVFHLNRECIGGSGSSRKMLSIMKEWVVEGGGGDVQEEHGKC